MKNILIIDTCITPAYLGIYNQNEGRIIYSKFEADNSVNEKLFDVMDNMLESQNLKAENLGAIVCIKGPGSFTGIRIGLALAKGLVEGLKINAAGLNSFDKYSTNGAVILPCDNNTVYLKIGDKIYDKPVAKNEAEKLTKNMQISYENDVDDKAFMDNIDYAILNPKKYDLVPVYIKGHYAEK